MPITFIPLPADYHINDVIMFYEPTDDNNIYEGIITAVAYNKNDKQWTAAIKRVSYTSNGSGGYDEGIVIHILNQNFILKRVQTAQSTNVWFNTIGTL